MDSGRRKRLSSAQREQHRRFYGLAEVIRRLEDLRQRRRLTEREREMLTKCRAEHKRMIPHMSLGMYQPDRSRKVRYRKALTAVRASFISAGLPGSSRRH